MRPRLLIPEASRPFKVGEQKGDCPRRQLCHATPTLGTTAQTSLSQQMPHTHNYARGPRTPWSRCRPLRRSMLPDRVPRQPPRRATARRRARHDPAHDDGTVDVEIAQRSHYEWRNREVGSVVHRQTHHVDVLLQGHCRDRFGGLAQPAVDDLEAGVAEDAGNDLDPPVVPVESDLGDQNSGARTTARSVHVPKTDSSAVVISPTVTYTFAASRSAGMTFIVESAASVRIRSTATRTASSLRVAFTSASRLS